MRLAAGLHHNLYPSSTFPALSDTWHSSLGVQYSQLMNRNSFVHPFRHLFIEHLIHARHSSSCLRYMINETEQNLCCFGRDLIIIINSSITTSNSSYSKFILEHDTYCGKKILSWISGIRSAWVERRPCNLK